MYAYHRMRGVLTHLHTELRRIYTRTHARTCTVCARKYVTYIRTRMYITHVSKIIWNGGRHRWQWHGTMCTRTHCTSRAGTVFNITVRVGRWKLIVGIQDKKGARRPERITLVPFCRTPPGAIIKIKRGFVRRDYVKSTLYRLIFRRVHYASPPLPPPPPPSAGIVFAAPRCSCPVKRGVSSRRICILYVNRALRKIRACTFYIKDVMEKRG